MVQYYPSLNEDHIDFISDQSLFFVASAPWAGEHINISPKAHPSRTFSVLGPNTVAYLDASKSGCETISHICENGRLTIMFSSFGASPQIMRLFGKGRVIERWDPYYQQLTAKMASENGGDIDITGARAIIVLKVQKVQTSRGFGVPLTANGEPAGTEEAEEDAITYADQDPDAEDAHRDMMDRSLDGLPGMMSARRSQDENIAVEDTKAWFRKVSRQQDAVALGVGLGILFMLLLSLVGVIRIKPIFIEVILNYQRRQIGIPEDHSWKSEL
jgi:hypothetical protein